MDDVPRKRPQSDFPQSSVADSVSPSKRSRDDAPNHSEMNGRPEAMRIPIHARTNPSLAGPSNNEASDDDSDDDDYTSSSGSSSSDDDDEGEEEESDRGELKDNDAIPRISARRKPSIRRMQNDQDLLSRLSAFLPQMKNANDDLQQEIAAGRGKDLRLDNDDEEHGEGAYIEMNLGLGVLEEKRSSDDHPPSDGESVTEEQNLSPQTNVLSRLMGRNESPSSEKPSIQELQ